MSEEIKESPTGELEQGEFKVKKKRGRPKKLVTKQETTKLDLSKKEEETKTENNAVSKSESKENVSSIGETPEEERKKTSVELQEMGETHSEKSTTSQESDEKVTVIEEITNDEPSIVEKTISEPVSTPQIELPENVEKLVDFMKDTGGTVEDYVRLNRDYSEINENALLKEYYKNFKPHLNDEEINFILEDSFLVDEEMDEERDIKKKKLAYKEEIAKAKTFLEALKGKYYEEIKLRPGVTQEQRQAMDFFNRYNEEQKIASERRERFTQKTKNFFNNEFKGFEFNIGEKKFRYNVNNVADVQNSQSNLQNFIEKFFNEKGEVSDHKGYHKAIYAAENMDTIANHFYEQGKADGVKNMLAKSNNISNKPRTTSEGEVYINGLKVKAISGANSSKLKIKKRKIT